MTRWDEDTPAFRIIRRLAEVRKQSAAIWKGDYKTVYAKDDVLVYERRCEDEVVLVVVNRGGRAKVDLSNRIDLPPGVYKGVLQETGYANEGNSLAITRTRARLRMNRLSSLVVWFKDAEQRD